MSDYEIDRGLEQYRTLLHDGRYQEAARLADNFLSSLFARGDEDLVREILVNTISTTRAPALLSSAWLNLGNTLYEKNLFDRARACFLNGLQAEDPQDEHHSANLLFGIANTYFMEGDYIRARQFYRDSLSLSQRSGLLPAIAENLVQLSEVSRTLGAYDEAESSGRSSLEINIQADRPRAVMRSAQSLSNLAIQLEASGEHDRAKELLTFCSNLLGRGKHSAALEFVRSVLANISTNNAK